MCGRLLLLCGSSTTILAPRFRRTDAAQFQFPLFQFPRRMEVADGLFLMSENILENLKHPPPTGTWQGYVLALPDEKFHAELPFQRPDLIGVGRLANAQNKRRCGETAFTGFGMKRS